MVLFHIKMLQSKVKWIKMIQFFPFSRQDLRNVALFPSAVNSTFDMLVEF